MGNKLCCVANKTIPFEDYDLSERFVHLNKEFALETDNDDNKRDDKKIQSRMNVGSIQES